MKRWSAIAGGLIGLLLGAGIIVGAWVGWGWLGLRVVVLCYGLLAASLYLWEYRRRGCWEYIVLAAGVVLWAVAVSNLHHLSEEGGVVSDVVVGFTLFAGIACVWVGAIAMLRRKRREKAAPSVPEENSEGV